MIDREKVRKGLECCITSLMGECKSDCPYTEDCHRSVLMFDLLCNALEMINRQPQWISVKDRMPPELHSMWFPLYGTPKWRNVMWREESDHVLVAITFEDGSQFVTSGYTQDGKWSTGISKILQYTVTHWMPLPEPPEVEQDD